MKKMRIVLTFVATAGVLIATCIAAPQVAGATELSGAPAPSTLTDMSTATAAAHLDEEIAKAEISASRQSRSVTNKGGVLVSTWTALEEAIDPGTQVFDGIRARHAGVSDETIRDFATGWVASGNVSANARIDASEVSAIRDEASMTRACAGKSRSDHTGLQYNYYMNSCNTAKLLGAIAVGAGAAAIAAIVMAATGVGGAAAGIVAGALTIAGGVISICSSKGRGIAIHILQFTNVVWCNNQ